MAAKDSWWRTLLVGWHLRKVPGGLMQGDADSVATAFIRAGVFTEDEREECIRQLHNYRVSCAAKDLADAIRRKEHHK